MKNILKFTSLSCPVLVLFVLPTVNGAIREVGATKAYTTISGCIAAAASGDTCNVHSGTYNENVIISKPIVVQANLGDAPKIVGVVSLSSGGSTISGFEVAPTTCSSYGISASGLSNITIKNNSVHGCAGGYGIYSRNSTRVLIDSNNVYGNHTGIGFLSCHSTDDTYANGCTISNNTVYDNPEDGTEGNGEYVTFTGNNVYNNIDRSWAKNHPDGIQFLAGCADGYCAGSHWRIYNNIFRNHTQNIFIEGITSDQSSDAVDVWIFNNVAYNDGTIVNSVDLSVLSTVSLMLKFAKDAYIFNNYFGDSGTNGRSAHVQRCYNGSVHVKNNTFSNSVGYGLYVEDPADIAAGELNANLYYTTTKESIVWGATFYSSVKEFRNAVTSQEAKGLSGDPKVNPLPSPTLQADSPLIGAGLDLSTLGAAQLDMDKRGASRPTNAWSIGPYEKSGSVIVNPPTALSATVN